MKKPVSHNKESIYVFTGSGASFPSGVFNTIKDATEWIERYSLSGILSLYPVNVGLYDWAIENEYFEVKNEYQKEAKFIEKFTCASIEHIHFEDGVID